MPRLPALPMAPLLERVRAVAAADRRPEACVCRFADQIEFLNLVAAATGDDLLGLHLAQHCELRGSGLFYYVLASSATLFDVCQRAARFSSADQRRRRAEFHRWPRDRHPLNFTGVSRHHDRHQVEFWFAASHAHAARTHRRSPDCPASASRHTRAMRGARELFGYFGCNVEFGAARRRNVVRPQAWANCPWSTRIRISTGLLVAIVRRSARASRHEPRTHANAVENAIAAPLPHGNARADIDREASGAEPANARAASRRRGHDFSTLLTESGATLRRAISRTRACRSVRSPGCSGSRTSARFHMPSSGGPGRRREKPRPGCADL